VWANNKVPYTLRKQLADALGFSEGFCRKVAFSRVCQSVSH
jgi:hypothetical protein